MRRSITDKPSMELLKFNHTLGRRTRAHKHLMDSTLP